LLSRRSQPVDGGGFRLDDLMHTFSWPTMLIFAMRLLPAVILLRLVTACISRLKQQRRQLSDKGIFSYVSLEPRDAYLALAPSRGGQYDHL
jgi:hypothetical protein